MFEAYSITSTTYALNEPIEFKRIRVNDSRIILDGNSSIRIKCPGKYLIKFNGVGASTTAATSFAVQLYRDDIAVPEAFSTITSTAANQEQTMMFETIITVNPSCCAIDNTTSLQILTEAAGVVNLANLIIVKLR